MSATVFFFIFSSVLLAGGILLFVLAPMHANQELGALKRSGSGGGSGRMGKSKLTLFHGLIGERNQPIVEDFVIGQGYEYRDSNDGMSWEKARVYRQEFFITAGDREIMVTEPEKFEIRGQYKESVNPKDDKLKIHGFTKGMPITVVGNVTSGSPMTVSAKYFYGGTWELYVARLKEKRLWFTILAGIPFLATLVFFIVMVVMFFSGSGVVE